MSETTITVGRDIRAERHQAGLRFQKEMAAAGTLVVRLISSPGAGKTALLEKTAQLLSGKNAVGILVGDVETDRDARRLAPYAPSRQITTGGACHLELPLIQRAIQDWGVGALDFLFVEDIGNLICPASHFLGEHVRVILLSTTEGDDKPGKYPKAFRTSQAMVISKIDLLHYVPFSVEQARADAWKIQPEMEVINVSALSGAGIETWCRYLQRQHSIHISGHGETVMPQRSEDARKLSS